MQRVHKDKQAQLDLLARLERRDLWVSLDVLAQQVVKALLEQLV